MTRLWIVDKHERFRRFAGRLLEAEGLDVIGVAHAAASALAAVARLRPDAALLDVQLSGGDRFRGPSVYGLPTGRPARSGPPSSPL